MHKKGPLSGQLLDGKYLLGELLGEGGFGVVYAGRHLPLNRPQAIKVLREHFFGRPEFHERFLREARVTAALDHPHIVHIDDFGIEEQASRAYLVMPFVGSGTFHDLLKNRQRPLEIEQVVFYMEQIASALDYAHRRGVVHLDLKPRNLLVREEGWLLLSDFGLAHLTKQGSIEGGPSLLFGSPHYMAPEHISGQPDKRSDVYALGVILYQMLVGQLPFKGPIPMETPLPLQALRPELPLELEEVLKRALTKQTGQRYQSAGELLLAFKEALATAGERVRQEEQPVRAGGVRVKRAPERAFAIVDKPDRMEVSRRTVILGLGLVGLVIVGGGAGWFVISHERGSPAPTLISTPAPIPLGMLLYTYHGHSHVNAVAWSPDGRRIASGSDDFMVQVWDAAGGGHVFTYKGHSNLVEAVAWSPDGRRIASGSFDKTVQVWDAADGSHAFTYRGHSDSVDAIAWSPDGKRIASGSYDKTVQVWDAANGDHAFAYRGHSNLVRTLAWSPDGKRIASGSFDKTVQVWDAADGSHAFTYRGHSGPVNAVAWSSDSSRIASGSNDATVQVWDAADGGHAFTYRGHSERVFAVAWSPDGRRIASGGNDNIVQVWNAADGGHAFTYRGHANDQSGYVTAVAWSPDGRRIASGNFDNIVQVWGAGSG